ncbi:hypothetical protein SDC9_206890 [bioreactor metagenome]|uniref:Uncharacterized protein n=1 Tax=bioreactor metagenome TaxID=1076179 RepID=A0A645J7Q2_9ZZZZ
MLLIVIILMDYTTYMGFVAPLITPLIVITVLLTIISGATYIYDNIEVIK